MKRKTLTIVSIVSIIIISLILLGVTYGYYLTTIDGNESSKSVEVVTGNSKVKFTDLYDSTSSDPSKPIEPGYKIAKVFTVENIGEVSATYSIYLVDVINYFNRKDDITYNLYKKLYKKDQTIPNVTIETDLSEASGWTQVNEAANVTFPTAMSVIASKENIKNPTDFYVYVLKVEYVNHLTENQNEDQGKTLNFKVNLRAEDSYTNPFSEGTLAYNIFENGAQVLNATTNELEIDKSYVEKTQIEKVSDGTDMEDAGIFTAPDDYGTSYYYRGPVKNNYVDFAGFTWRIVRINGDGSIRLILDDILDKVCADYEKDSSGNCTEVAGYRVSFNSNLRDNASVGYMYGLTGAKEYNCVKEDEIGTKYIDVNIIDKKVCKNNGGEWVSGYDTTHMNINDSEIKYMIDVFYVNYIENGTTKQYEKYLADTMFCGDKSLASSGIGGVTTQLGYGTGNKTYYAATERLLYSNGTTSITTANPTLKCAEGESNTYSRYTKEVQNRNNINTNGDLKYPIALLSADELVLAGAFNDKKNQAYYLYDAFANATQNYFVGLLTPTTFNGSEVNMFIQKSNGSLIRDYPGFNLISGRPVINLKADLLVAGDGTKDNAYTINEIG